jgi:hypothetical protein
LLVSSLCLVACGGSSFTQAGNDAGLIILDSGVINITDPAVDAGSDAGTDAGTDAGVFDGGVFDAGFSIDPMTPISFGLPAFASNNSSNAVAANANGTNPQVCWASASLPGWVAYDLSTVPLAQRHEVLAAWYSLHVGDYVTPTAFVADEDAPVDYTLELNTATGGASPPTTGWTAAETVVANDRSGRMFTLDLNGANWIRMNVSRGSNPATVCLNLDVYTAPAGGTDSWLFLGDSITHNSMVRAFSDLPSRVHAAQPDRWPAILEGAIGGTRTVDALVTFDNVLKNFPGRFVVLAYGTNDDATNFQMEPLVQKVIALGKTPVVPHMPWAPDAAHQATAAVVNPIIDGLYLKYPQILKGPDLYGFFSTHQSDIPVNDIHPNAVGQADLRAQWAITIESVGQ